MNPRSCPTPPPTATPPSTSLLGQPQTLRSVLPALPIFQPRATSSILQTLHYPPYWAVCFHTAARGSPQAIQSRHTPALGLQYRLSHPEESSFSHGPVGSLSLLTFPASSPDTIPLLSALGSQALTIPHTHKQHTHLRTFALTLPSAPNALALKYFHSGSLTSLRFYSSTT